jgi:aspartate 1-decarboxylase
MLKCFVSGKIHGMRVTHKSLDYNGSCSLPRALMDAAGIEEFEQIHMVNKANGNRWVTYVIEGEPGELRLNGAAARMGEVGDECLLFTYRWEEGYSGAKVVFLDPATNTIARIAEYANP